MKNKTPRTDDEAITQDYETPQGEHRTLEVVGADFARQLERELNKANAKITNLRYKLQKAKTVTEPSNIPS